MAFIKNILSGFLGIKKDPNATTQDVAVIKAEDTNSSIAIVPNGTGAIVTTIPDGTTTGGNSRGTYAIDLQTLRGENSAVNRGSLSSLLGGENNKIEGGTHHVIVGGSSNRISSGGNNQFIGGGGNNVILGTNGTQDFNVIVGGSGNVAESGNNHRFMFIGGGSGNIVSEEWSSVVGGCANTTTAKRSVVIGGGGNTSSGECAISGGSSAIASGQNSVAFGSGRATNTYTFASGRSACATNIDAFAHGQNARALGSGSVAIGNTQGAGCVLACGQGSVALGLRNCALGNYTFATGCNSKACFSHSIAINNSTYMWGEFTTRGTTSNVLQKNYAYLDAEEQTLYLKESGNTQELKIVSTGWNGVILVEVSSVASVGDAIGTVTGVSKNDQLSKKDILSWRIRSVTNTSVVDTITNVFTSSSGGMGTSDIIITPLYTTNTAILNIKFKAPTFTGGGQININTLVDVKLTYVESSSN